MTLVSPVRVIALAALAMVLCASIGKAQTTSCPPEDGTIEGLSARVGCLEEALASMAASQGVLERTILNVYAQVEAMGLEMRGPEKALELIPASDRAVTQAYWADGTQRVTIDCVSPASSREGFTVFGAELGPEVKITIVNAGLYGGFRGCAGPPYCDGAGEHCAIQPRARGCYVNTLWFDWLQRQPDAAVTYETVCE